MTKTYASNTFFASYLKCRSVCVSQPFYHRCFSIWKKEVKGRYWCLNAICWKGNV